ncbi:hypothetical protein TNCV_2479571, partial [Trichonephila clavipes]
NPNKWLSNILNYKNIYHGQFLRYPVREDIEVTVGKSSWLRTRDRRGVVHRRFEFWCPC